MVDTAVTEVKKPRRTPSRQMTGLGDIVKTSASRRRVEPCFVGKKIQISIGRDDSCDILIEDRSVSRLHAIMRREDDSISLEDRGSRNGTKINNRPISRGERSPLRPGCTVLFGRVKARFMDADAFFEALAPLCSPPFETGRQMLALTESRGDI